MASEEILPDLYQLSLGVANAFLVAGEDHLVLIDTGATDVASALLNGIQEAGYWATDVDHILLTHCHQDHAGGLAAAKKASGAEGWMHPADAALVEQGRARHPWTPTPGLLNRVLYWIYVRGVPDHIPAAEIEHRVQNGETVPSTGGLEAIHVPGHSKGQLAFLWPRHGGVLIAGDVAMNVLRLQRPLVHEDVGQGRQSLRRLSRRTFRVAVFGHGRPILDHAEQKFREAFGTSQRG